MFAATAILCFVLAVLLYVLQRRPKNYPPGPRNWPLVGTIPAMMAAPNKTPFDQSDHMIKNFGNIVGLFVGLTPTILVSGYENVKKISAMEEFSYKPLNRVAQHKMFNFEPHGVMFTEGPRWRNQRRFTLRHLRDFGFGNKKMDQYIHDEVSALFEIIAKDAQNRSAGVDVMTLMPVVALNTLWYIIAGVRKELDDEQFVRLTQLVLKSFRLGDLKSPVAFYPLLQHIPYINSNFRQQVAIGEHINNFIGEAIKEHMNTFDENHMRDYMDVYIREMQQDPTGDNFNVNQLTAICNDLFLAGTETTSSTIGFTLRYLIKHPEVQTKVREELHRVVGRDRLPSLDDVPNLPYCSAVLAEVMRHATVAPFPPRKAPMKDTNFEGYFIPKRTMVLVNLRSVLWDPEHWGDPENFRPERFIGPDGSYRKDEYLMIFGSGTRYCLGEPFARNSVFIFYTSLVQNYQLRVPPLGPEPSNVTLPGFTLAPEPFRVTFVKI